jgi:hypothetical protein
VRKLQPICVYVTRGQEREADINRRGARYWLDAGDRAGLKGKDYNIKDILAKALTDGRKQGTPWRISRSPTRVPTRQRRKSTSSNEMCSLPNYV